MAKFFRSIMTASFRFLQCTGAIVNKRNRVARQKFIYQKYEKLQIRLFLKINSIFNLVAMVLSGGQLKSRGVFKSSCANAQAHSGQEFRTLATGGRSIDLIFGLPKTFGCRQPTPGGSAFAFSDKFLKIKILQL